MAGDAPIIIKKVKKGHGHGHHGGAWKVAYADFVTAMMAFFLLMWLLNATSEEQLHGLADYFDPSIPISRNSAGGAGMLQGDTIFTPERVAGSAQEGERARPSNRDPGTPLGTEPAFPGDPVFAEEPGGAPETDFLESTGPGVPTAETLEKGPEDGGEAAGGLEPGTDDGTGSIGDDGSETGAGPEAQPGEGAGEGEGEGVPTVAELEAEIESALFALDGSAELLRHFKLRVTPEGVVIEIADLAGAPLFAPGSAEPSTLGLILLEIATDVLSDFDNPLSIVGHTDATPFRGRSDYSNWELSTDRANSARRIMKAFGMNEARIVRVSGRSDTQPLAGDPFDPQNRRIAIILLRPGVAD